MRSPDSSDINLIAASDPPNLLTILLVVVAGDRPVQLVDPAVNQTQSVYAHMEMMTP